MTNHQMTLTAHDKCLKSTLGNGPKSYHGYSASLSPPFSLNVTPEVSIHISATPPLNRNGDSADPPTLAVLSPL